jgi:type VI secretion system protein ImpF
MIRPKKPDRFVPPLMQAFRAAFRERDAGKTLDLKDEAGERIIAGRRSSPRNVVSESTLRQELAEDLGSLFNTVNMASAEDLRQAPFVLRSILNYGLTDLTAISIDEHAVEDIGAELRTVLASYEPRLIAETVAVERDRTVDETSLKIRFNIHAEMFATPVDVPVEFIADVEIDSGKLKISRL